MLGAALFVAALCAGLPLAPTSDGTAAARGSFPWQRTPLKASPGIGRPEVVDGNRSSGVLTDAEIAWLAATHDVIILSGATQDPMNQSTCGELRVGDAARRIKAANASARYGAHYIFHYKVPSISCAFSGDLPTNR